MDCCYTGAEDNLHRQCSYGLEIAMDLTESAKEQWYIGGVWEINLLIDPRHKNPRNGYKDKQLE